MTFPNLALSASASSEMLKAASEGTAGLHASEIMRQAIENMYGKYQLSAGALALEAHHKQQANLLEQISKARKSQAASILETVNMASSAALRVNRWDEALGLDTRPWATAGAALAPDLLARIKSPALPHDYFADTFAGLIPKVSTGLGAIAEEIAQRGVITEALSGFAKARLDFYSPHTAGAIASVLAGSREVQELADSLEDEFATEVDEAVHQVGMLRQGSLTTDQWSTLASQLVTYLFTNAQVIGIAGFDPTGVFIVSTLLLVLALRRLDNAVTEEASG